MEYKLIDTDSCDRDEIQTKLNESAKEGWRFKQAVYEWDLIFLERGVY